MLTLSNRASKTREVFKRDRSTWFAYLLFGFWSYAWGMFGPIMPFLRQKFHLNYMVASLHFSALALGLVIAGLIGHHVLVYLGAKKTILIGTALILYGMSLVICGNSSVWTISGAGLVGLGGSHSGQAITASLAFRYKNFRTKALTELNTVSSLLALAAPLVVATVLNVNLSWKIALALSFPLCFFIYLLSKPSTSGDDFQLENQVNTIGEKLPAIYWFYFFIVFMSVAAEWSVCFWCPEYLERVHNFSHVDACSGLSIFLTSILLGRFLGSRIASSWSTRMILITASALAFAGSLFFWLGPGFLSIPSLIILGLGQANFYPSALSAAISSAQSQSTRVTSLMSLSTGSAILLAPFFLGALADKIGIWSAFGLVSVLFALVGTMIFSVTITARSPD